MPDPDFDPDYLNRIRWFRITIPFAWIAKIWRKIFKSRTSTVQGKRGDEDEKD